MQPEFTIEYRCYREELYAMEGPFSTRESAEREVERKKHMYRRYPQFEIRLIETTKSHKKLMPTVKGDY